MAIKVIAHKPAMTKKEAQEIFARHFSAKYKVEACRAPLSLKTAFRDFQIVKNPIIGVALKLEQTDTETKFVYAAVSPIRWIRSLSFGVVGTICFFFGRGLESEVEAFIESAPEFK